MDTFIVWWLLASARVTATVMVAPLVSQQSVPLWTRLAIAFALSLVLGSQGPLASSSAIAVPDVIGDWTMALGKELALGLTLGIAVGVVIMAARMGGQLIGHLAGFSWDSVAETKESPELPSAKLMAMVVLLIYILVGGPERLIAALFDSFEAIPVAAAAGGLRPAWESLLLVLQQGFWLTVVGVGPIVAAWLLTQFGFGLIQRLAPQFGLFQLGLQTNLVVFWLGMLLMIAGAAWVYERELLESFARLTSR